MVKIENMVEVECPVLNKEGLGGGLKHHEIGLELKLPTLINMA